MTKLTGETLNIEEKNIIKIKELFPEIDTDGKIDFDKLKQLLGDYVEDLDERYNFTWNGKGEALRISQTPSMGTLRPAPEESKNWDETENLYIEGDNLEVLKLLQKSYFNKVDVIYIDPPYNTGGDFVYEDDFKDNIKNYKEITGQVDSDGRLTTTNKENSGRYHTDWLNMMYPRLRLARNLLTDDGVILISIDDNEIHNLKNIMDEIFGENNFIANFIWEKNPNPTYLNKYSRNAHEYIIGYSKNINSLDGLYEKHVYTKNEDSQPLQNKGNPMTTLEIKSGVAEFGFDTDKIDKGKYGLVEVHNDILISENKNTNNFKISGTFRFRQNYLDDAIKEGRKNLFKSNKMSPRLTNIRKEFDYFAPISVLNTRATTSIGVNQIKNIFKQEIFNYPKPTYLISKLISFINPEKQSMTILDFFAGSSTTAHAAMDLNAENNSNHKFLMVQLPEETDKKSEAYKSGYENIAEIGKGRIRRAGEQIKDELTEKYESASEEERKEMKHPDDLDIGFKTFKLDSSNIKEWNPGQYDDVQLAIEDSLTPYVEGRTEKDVVYEMILKMGLDLTYPVEEYEVNGNTIYSVGYGFLMISLADEIDLAVAEKMIEIKDEHQPEEFRVIFRDEGFRNDTDKTNIKETLRSAGLAEEAFITL